MRAWLPLKVEDKTMGVPGKLAVNLQFQQNDEGKQIL